MSRGLAEGYFHKGRPIFTEYVPSSENQQEERNRVERKRLKAKVVQVRKHTFQTITSEGISATMYRNITIRRTV